MATTDLLSAILPPEGVYCTVGLQTGKPPRQKFFETLEECAEEFAYLTEENYEVYYACAKYETPTRRTTNNATYIKAFWIDLDCGEGKPYPDQASALLALKTFCKKLKLPKPTLVNSGRGIHVYWRLKETISRADWLPVAERLKYLCEEHELHQDRSRTSDPSSVLRVPETFNRKEGGKRPITILSLEPEIGYEDFKNLLGVLIAPPEFDIPRFEQNELTKALAGNQENWFKIIIAKTIKGKGCAQIAKIATEQDTVDYNLWRAGLSVAWACEDRHEAIHKISERHSDYNYQTTIKKAQDTGGPQKCGTFEKWNPGGCDGCPNKGKIVGPIALGKKIVEATDNTIPEPVEVEAEAEEAQEEIEDNTKIPPFPKPYFRGKNGGVYKAVEDEDPVLIYHHDLYIVKRLYDPNKGDTIWLRLHTPRDGLREFALPQTDLLTKEKLRDRLAFYGVVALQKQMDSIMQYIAAFVKDMQYKRGVEIMRLQFGWAEKNRKFIIGDQEITPNGVRYSPPSSITSTLSEYMTPVGTLEAWKEVVNIYDGEGLEPHAFGFFTAFGSPLLTHLQLKGAVINLINNRSGTGKTTVALAMHSVYGHPEEQMLIWRDTMNMKLNRLGIMNNLPVSIDEITKMTADDLSDLLYAISQGRARGRLKSNENAERINTSKWSLIAVATSNASFYDKLTTLSSTPDGELMRLVEYQIPENTIISKTQADELFPKLYSNYGHAGRIYLQWLVGNLEEAVDMVRECQKIIDQKIKFSGRERFWSGIAACNIAGAMIARRLGLIDIDIGRVFKWMVNEFSTMRREIKPPATDQTSVIGEFLNENRGRILVINDAVDKRTGMDQLPIVEPKFDLQIRIEPDTKKMFIAASKLKEFCVERRVTLKDVLKALENDEIYLNTMKKRMGKGTKIPGLPTTVYVFDCSKEDFISADQLTESLKHEDSRDQLQH